MENRRTLNRRTVVKFTAAAVGTTALAGCTGSGADDDTADSGESGTDTDAEDSSSDTGGAVASEPEYDGWFDDVDSYEQTADMTGEDSVTVQVGAEDGLAFGPAAVAVDAGTTVIWEWTGEGGSHNVSAENGDFESETVDEEGYTFEQTVDQAGVFKYACTPHRTLGMKGAIVVQ